MAPSPLPIESGGEQAVVFSSPGMKPDTRLQVFSKVFHVHSILLKLHSAYFRTFLDSLDKTLDLNAAFRYDYVSVVDADGTWGLEVRSKAPPQDLQRKLKNDNYPGGDPTFYCEETAFEKLLCAIYSRSYTITNVAEFMDIIRLADFYRSLPMLSASLYAALWNSPGFIVGIPASAASLLIVSQKLRHPVLFRECFVHVVSRWKGPDDTVLKDHPDLCHLITASQLNVSKLVVAADHAIMLNCAKSQTKMPDKIFQIASVLLYSSRPPLETSSFYRALYRKSLESNFGINPETQAALRALLDNGLALDRTGSEAGTGNYSNVFLCAWILDSDLPWDQNESDW